MFAADTAAADRQWLLQVQALVVAPMDAPDLRASDAIKDNLRRLPHPYLGCLIRSDPEQLHQPILSGLEKSLLQAEAFGERSSTSVENPLSIPFITSIPLDICRLRYQPYIKKTIRLDIDSPPPAIRPDQTEQLPVFVQRISVVKEQGSFFEVETNTYYFDRNAVGSSKILYKNV
jgi:hypothetical protein